MLATVPTEYGSNKDGLWRFNDSRCVFHNSVET